MLRAILVYADCRDATTNGDYSLAGSIARDLTSSIRDAPDYSDVHVVLTTQSTSLPKFHSLYGVSQDGVVTIDGTPVRIAALEAFDLTDYASTVWIEANRCKYPPAEALKRVLLPDSKLIIVGSASCVPILGESKGDYINQFDREQPGIYPYFSHGDFAILCGGLGHYRIGFPHIAKIDELAPLGEEEGRKIPNKPYGFIYAARLGTLRNMSGMVAQYLQMTGCGYYILIGQFSGCEQKMSDYIAEFMTANDDETDLEQAPEVHRYESVDKTTMRHMIAGAVCLVVTTGISSTMEAMVDGKLVFYQYLEINSAFVQTYLETVRSLCCLDATNCGPVGNVVFALSKYLFAPKPLPHESQHKLKRLLKNAEVTQGLPQTNQKMIAAANGRVAGQLLSFIGKPKSTSAQHQCTVACYSLRKPGESHSPTYDQALRRASTWGRLFELRILLRNMACEDRNKVDPKFGRTALQWAVMKEHLDCVRVLTQYNVSLDVQDTHQKTALHYAVMLAQEDLSSEPRREMVQHLVRAGASVLVVDEDGKRAFDYAEDEEWVALIDHGSDAPDVARVR